MKLLPNNEISLRIRDPSIITTLIPHARVNGHDVFVPHKLEETKVLRNMGINVPAPILTSYNWPGEYTPYQHQYDTSSFCTLHKRCFVFNGMGTMKTISSLWAADWLMQQGMIRKALILSTLSCVDATWYREIFRNFMHRTAIVVHGTRHQRWAALACDVDFFIMNHHGMLVVQDELAKRTDIDLIILDEGSMLRNGQTQIYKNFVKYMRPDQWLWVLTGKPCPNGPTDAWALARLVSPHRVPPFFTRWKDETMRKVSLFKWVPRENATQRMYDAMQPAIRFEKKDCLDLPETVFLYRSAELSAQQLLYYQMMKTKLVLWAQSHQITAVNAAVLMGKLLQICAGAVKTDDGEYVGLDTKPRLAALDEVISEASAKVIVLVPYTGALRQVADHIRKTHTVEIIDGSVSRGQRGKILSAFQDHADPHVIVAHPKPLAHGLNMTAADTIVWFSPIHSLDIYDQANERTARPGQKLQTNLVHIYGCPLEEKVYRVLQNKGHAQNDFLDMFKNELLL